MSKPEDLFRHLFEHSGVSIALLNPELRVRRANADLVAMLGRAVTEVAGIEFADLVHTSAEGQLRTRFEDLRAGRCSRFTEHATVRRADGTKVACALTAVRVSDADHVTTSVVVVLLVDPDHDEAGSAAPRKKMLSDVDARVLEGVAAGTSTIQLATELYLSRQGVEYHVSAMLRRLRVPNRSALVSRAFAMGILKAGVWPPRVHQDYVA